MNIAEKPMYSIIVPVYNSEQTLEELVTRLERVMSIYPSYELLLIDDFSYDGSWEKIKEVKANKSYIRGLRLTKNFGQAAVNICGLHEAKAEIMVTIDDDLQFPPEEIPKLIAAFNPKTHYLICGVPKHKQLPFLRRIIATLATNLINILVLKNEKKMLFSSFRILTKIALRREKYNERRMKNIQVFFNMVSPRLVDYIYVNHEPRKKGKSNYNFIKKIYLFVDMLIVTTEIHTYLFIYLFLIFGIAGLAAFGYLFFYPDNNFSSFVFPILMTGFAFLFLGLLIVLKYLRQLFLSHNGVEVYAIWEEC